jgi:hypothetical protein
MSLREIEDKANKIISFKFVIGLFCALLVACGLVYGYALLRKKLTVQEQRKDHNTASLLSDPKVTVFENETRLAGKFALISGTLQNNVSEPLSKLNILFELSARNRTSHKETRVLNIDTPALQAGQQITYNLKVPWNEFSLVRIISVTSNGNIICQPANQKCLQPGKERPKETTPDSLPAIRRRELPVPQKRKPATGDEVINTPETADPY